MLDTIEAPSLTCAFFLTGRPLFPVRVSGEKDKRHLWPGHDLYRVDEGRSGIVFKAEPHTGTLYDLIKVYKGGSYGETDLALHTRDGDLLLLEKFAQMGDASECGFDFAQGVPINVHTTYSLAAGRSPLPGIRFDPQTNRLARSVYSLLTDETLDPGLKKYIGSEYRRKMALLEECLRTRLEGRTSLESPAYRKLGGVFDFPFVGMSVRLPLNSRARLSLDMLIKADGVMVEPRTLRFFVGDGS